MIFLMNFIQKNHNMKNNSIIIIGNGPSVLNYNFGELIDKHSLIPSEIIKRKNNNLNRHVQKRLKKNNLNPVIISLNDISNFEKNTGLNRLTTGLYSILWAIENYEEVIIHGFDFFQNFSLN